MYFFFGKGKKKKAIAMGMSRICQDDGLGYVYSSDILIGHINAISLPHKPTNESNCNTQSKQTNKRANMHYCRPATNTNKQTNEGKILFERMRSRLSTKYDKYDLLRQ